MIFYSKHDSWLGIVLFGPTSYAVLQTYFDMGMSFVTVLLLGVLAFVSWIWFGTYYRIEDGLLKVRCGPSFGKYDISKINSIRDSKSWLSSPACSLDRLEIRGETFNVIISPKHKMDFIASLQEINMSIEYIEQG